MNDILIEAPVLFEERAARRGRRIGIATLNAPRALNGLSLDMARLLDEKLVAWAKDEAIAVVVLQGAGEKAFCAGGDLQGLYRGMLDYQVRGGWSGDPFLDPRGNVHAEAFFETEYRLDYRIHTYPKPILCWGHGIVMGGGIGLMAGASHRVVSERSRLAFPEITVGLFPDVGGSWVLNRVPARAGLFLALTGAPLSAGDALYAGMADHLIAETQRADVMAAACDTVWSDRAEDNHRQLSALLQGFGPETVAGPLQQHAELIASLCAHDELADVVSAVAAIEHQDPWLQTAKATLAAGSPGSARLGHELQRRTLSLSLADVFRLEYTVALHCAAHGDFAEGIRALLIDKDRNPQWNPSHLRQADRTWAATFFHAPWPEDQHPLADLGRTTGAHA
ncbi:enoyl-CoA hydratase [Pseudoxanthomonas jiangsuensis]|uniref:enoyl-CoA hydratase/isomerase family protein n=1 Tax=Pseudoxanthomonas jiangsuensis TaxID=619688 RepID=UPI001391DBD9|nr:enoyl-CoA hydratase/isomerase family protein [Pseudoxanthomonas jiangsuensis]KAF1697256.1 enoyl-CoA hydratase [Pseudoxanthomonas jiangsuensis]